MEHAVRLCMLALAACAAILIIKGKNPHGAMLLSAAACIVLAVQLVPAVRSVYEYCLRLVRGTGVDYELFVPLLKVLGITVCVRVTSELCRDSGERALASKVEIAGAVTGLVCALPLMERALALIGGL